MNYDLRYYTRVYNNFLDKVECEDTISQIKDVEFEQHKFYNHGTGEMAPASGEDELDFFCDFNVCFLNLFFENLVTSLSLSQAIHF